MTVAAARPLPRSVRPRIDVDAYYRMARDGLIAPDAQVELLDGEIIDMPPIGPEHASIVDELGNSDLWQTGGRLARIRVQGPVRLDAYSEPQPDVAILRWRDDLYRKSHPGPEDVLLLIDVADSTLVSDRTRKIPLYARAGISEVWLVNLATRVVEVYRDPVDGAYAPARELRSGLLTPQLMPEVGIDVGQLFG